MSGKRYWHGRYATPKEFLHYNATRSSAKDRHKRAETRWRAYRDRQPWRFQLSPASEAVRFGRYRAYWLGATRRRLTPRGPQPRYPPPNWGKSLLIADNSPVGPLHRKGVYPKRISDLQRARLRDRGRPAFIRGRMALSRVQQRVRERLAWRRRVGTFLPTQQHRARWNTLSGPPDQRTAKYDLIYGPDSDSDE